MIKKWLINHHRDETYLVEDSKITHHRDVKLYHIYENKQKQSLLLLDGKSYVITDIDYNSQNNTISYKIINYGSPTVSVVLQTELEQRISQWRKGSSKNQITTIKSLMPGKIANLYVQINQQVEPGTPLATIESMKMLNTIYAQNKGTITQIFIKEQQFVDKDITIFKIKPLAVDG